MSGIYMIKLNEGVEAQSFASFMVEEVFPELAARGVTRVGKVDFLQLWRGSNTGVGSDGGNQDEFLWLVGGTVNGMVGSVLDKIEQRGARVKHLGGFDQAGLWRE